MKKKQKIVTIGGGTGSFTVLSGLKKYDVDLTAIVNMADDGGSTGILRDELGVLPPGDIRQCLVALSKSSDTLRELFNYRYSKGRLSGHNFGNIFLSTLEKVSGSIDQAIKEAGVILRIRGRVVPVTLQNTRLVVALQNGKKINGQHRIDMAYLSDIEKFYLKPEAHINPEVITAIKKADKIVINPGNLYCSLLPNFLVDGLSQAVIRSKAKKIMVCNLMTKHGHTDNFTAMDFLDTIEKYLKPGTIDYMLYNNIEPELKLLRRYARIGEECVKLGDITKNTKTKFISTNMLSKKIYLPKIGDKLERTLIRHDSDKLAQEIMNI